MAKKEHLEILAQGWRAWNDWRQTNTVVPDLSDADIYDVHPSDTLVMIVRHITKSRRFQGINFNETNLTGARFHERLYGADFGNATLVDASLEGLNVNYAHFEGANLSGANLRGAKLKQANFSEANLTNATLSDADMEGADLSDTVMVDADLSGANLSRTRLVRTNLQGASITNCSIYGLSAWDVNVNGTNQSNLVISPRDTPAITVDNLEVGQFIYLLLNNQKIRDVINTLGQKAVLILGRFSPERKRVLDALADELRKRSFLPIIFDFDKSQQRDFTETLMVLAGLSLFVIADITNPKSSPLELHATIPNYMIPFVPIIQRGEAPFSMFADLQRFDWVLDVLEYDDLPNLLRSLDADVINPALAMHDELIARKARTLRIRHASKRP